MSRFVTEGKCYYCSKVVTKHVMMKHLDTCDKGLLSKDLLSDEKCFPYFHILADAYDIYWMHIAVSASAKLRELDKFLRDTWLECCGHVSTFKIDGFVYSSYPEESFCEKSMLCKLFTLLSHGMEFIYEYDSALTTEINLKVLGELELEPGHKKIEIMARNEPVEFICSSCPGKASFVCSYCEWDGTVFLCKSCAMAHRCGVDMLLPVVNSPRMGICRYGL